MTKSKTDSNVAPDSDMSERVSIAKHPFVVPVLTFLGLFVVTLIAVVMMGSQTVGPTDKRVVNLYVDGTEKTVPTRAKTVRELLERLDVKTTKNDIVEPSIDAEIDADNFAINIYKARTVVIVDEDSDKQISTVSAQPEPRDIAKEIGLKVYPEDIVSTTPPDDFFNDGLNEQVVIDRAMLTYINLYGNKIPVRTHAKTVGELLKEKDIHVQNGDQLSPTADTKVIENAQVFVAHVGAKIQTKREKIPAPVRVINDPGMDLDSEKIVEEGRAGELLVTYELVLRKGKVHKKRVLQKVVSKKPIQRVVRKGTRVVIAGNRGDWLKAAGISPSDYYAVDHIVGRESGWCPTKWQGEYGSCPAYHGAPSDSSGLGYGLCQSTPAGKMRTAGSDWATNPVTQLKWCDNYAKSAHGGWQGALDFWQLNHWW